MSDKSADVCIIGGGLVGLFASLFLSQRGRSVIVLEKGKCGREASGTNFGNLRLQGRKVVEYPMAIAAHEVWEGFERLTGESAGFRGCGHSYFALGAGDHARLEQYASEAVAHGVDVTLLDRAAIAQRWPSLSSIVTAATWSPRDATAEPALAAPAVARAAVRAGVDVMEQVRATAISAVAGGLRVDTDRGVSIRCERVVNAAGAWAGKVAADLGETAPIFQAGPPIIETAPVRDLGLPSMLAADGSVIFRQTERGSIVTSSFPRLPADLESGHGEITPERTARDLIRLAEVLPALAQVKVERSWSGVEGYMPDLLPVISPSGTTPGVIHAFGLSGHGFQLAPAVARIVTDLAVDGRSELPTAPFSIGRFGGRVDADERVYREFEPALVKKVTAS